jgi:hypothetical protein
MKTFNEYKNLNKYNTFEFLTEEENAMIDDYVLIIEKRLEEEGKTINDIDESFFSRILGGAAGFVVGPTIGKIIARALGIEKGIIFDLLSSRLVATALGASIAKHLEDNQ